MKLDVCYNLSQCVCVCVSVCLRAVMSVFPPWWWAGVKVCGTAPPPQPEGMGPCWQQGEG